MTGINPSEIVFSIIIESIPVGLPTKPKSNNFSIFESLSSLIISSFSALINPSLCPVSPLAFPPVALISLTIFVFISLAKTSSTTLTVSLSVTLNPSIKSLLIFFSLTFHQFGDHLHALQ